MIDDFLKLQAAISFAALLAVVLLGARLLYAGDRARQGLVLGEWGSWGAFGGLRRALTPHPRSFSSLQTDASPARV